VGKRVFESLIAAGAFDCFGHPGAALMAGLDRVMGMAIRAQDNAVSGQSDIFGAAMGAEPEKLHLPNVEPWLPAETLHREFQAVGFYFSAHPLDEYRPVLQKLRVQTWAEFAESVQNGATAGRLAATVTGKQERRIRSGSRMGTIQLSDPTGSYEAVIFSEGLSEYRDILEPGSSVVVLVSAEERPEGINVRIQSVESLDRVTAGLHGASRFLDAAASRSWRAFRPPVAPLEPEDGFRSSSAPATTSTSSISPRPCRCSTAPPGGERHGRQGRSRADRRHQAPGAGAVADSAKRSAQYYVNSRWLGGMLTNWKTISRSIARLRKVDEILAGGGRA
jgi:hypothetical protein